jgi:hypothetical protein
MGWLVALVLAGTVTAGCSDNNGRATPTSADATGFANTSADIKIFLGINPSSITPGQRAGVTAVVTNTNGQPLAGKSVQFSTTVGSLDTVSGTTNSKGQFSTFLRVSQTDVTNCNCTSGTVTAFVEGAQGTGTVNFGGAIVLVLNPPSVIKQFGSGQTTGGSCLVIGGGFSTQFVASGGVPPYTFSVGGALGGTISSTGLYTVVFNFQVAAPFTGTDTVTVIDSEGHTATATVTISCTNPQVNPAP